VGSAVSVIGPGAIAIVVGFIVVWAAAVAVVIDALRRRSWDFAGVAEGRWPYIVISGLYGCVALARQVPALAAAAPWSGAVQVLGVPVMCVVGVTYLLRVVFPTPKRLELRRAARDGAVPRT
jgi:hypothetical protein